MFKNLLAQKLRAEHIAPMTVSSILGLQSADLQEKMEMV